MVDNTKLTVQLCDYARKVHGVLPARHSRFSRTIEKASGRRAERDTWSFVTTIPQPSFGSYSSSIADIMNATETLKSKTTK